MRLCVQLRWILLLALLDGFLSSPLCAQRDDKAQDVAERTCAKAEKILRKGHPDKKEEWAFFRMASCENGAAALANVWASPPEDSVHLKLLQVTSSRVSDRRMLDATLRAMANTQSVSKIRRAAMHVVYSQYDPTGVIGDDAWDSPVFGGFGHASHAYQRTGEMPLTTKDRASILTAFRSTAAADPDPQIRKVAGWLLQWLRVP